ncbi:hypothetical protein [Streptomyces platensis]|uniref:hypothetical protein n=1 Tax=Streptomyces platensis TaxID=58346 RepID=UPI001302DE10|nr:hypothetical protein [Streptomyces platensis]
MNAGSSVAEVADRCCRGEYVVDAALFGTQAELDREKRQESQGHVAASSRHMLCSRVMPHSPRASERTAGTAKMDMRLCRISTARL